MRMITSIIIHCTDSDDSLDIGFREINDWHRDRGWLSPSGISCGYHFIVRRGGKVERGRPDDEMGAHCKGKNRNSLGIVWVGRKAMSPDQRKSLLNLVAELCEIHGLSRADDVFGHCEFEPNKTCPNIDMVRFRADLVFVRL